MSEQDLQARITFRDMDPSDAIRAEINKRFDSLKKVSSQITDCHVTVSAPHKNKSKGKQFHVQIEVHVPGNRIAVTRDPGDNNSHEDMYVTVRDAFNAAKRQLQDFVTQRRDRQKQT